MISRHVDNGRAKPVAHHLQALLSHPFTPTEDALVTSFCLSPSSSSIPKTLTADWRLSKFIAEGRPIDALRFWAQAKSSVKPNDERERLLKAVHATLTEVQRNELALEADDYTPAVASTSRTPSAATTSNITQPAWQPVPLPAPTPLPRNLIATPRTTAPPTSQPTPADLPLSASPFLRRENPLVSSVDGSAMGGVQKSVLRALREGAAGNTSPFKSGGGLSDSPEKASAGSPFRSAAVARESLFGSPRVGTPVAPQSQPQVQYPAYSSPQPAPSSARKPTLAGFGSVRLPSASAAYGKARDESLSLFAAAGGKERWDEQAGGEDEAMGMDVEEEEHVGGEHQDEEEVEDQTFGFRAAQDPSIAATIAAAAAPTSATASSSKRRNRSSMGTSTDKRRAVSTEPEDRRPSASVKVGKTPAKGGRRSSKASATPTTASKSKVLPGGWDDGDSDAGHDHDDTEPEQQEVLAKATRTRRSARASSAQPATPQAKPKPKAARAEPAVATPRPTRRSSRLQTPAKEDAEDAAPRSVRKAAGGTARKAGSGRRKAIEEEEEEE